MHHVIGYFLHIVATAFVWINNPFVLWALSVHAVDFSYFENFSSSKGMPSKLDEIKPVSSADMDNLSFSFLLGMLDPLISLSFKMSHRKTSF